ncbi:MAG TPA: lipoate--protein ligase family protein [Gemmatimonadaceae bacterium]|nr:lipoate--protein ligase family protein [Gemmatimonadaceae bacterium]
MHPRRSFSRWRLLLAAPRSGAENMARDSALQARAARTGETVFSVYSWTRPTLSFGRHQPAAGRYDIEKIRSANVDVVRRPTGGRAILHDREVTYSVTAPIWDDAPLREAYARINRLLIDGLGRLGADVELASTTERAPVPSTRPCFETPDEGELVARGQKLVGSAQWREDGALLQHGSILVDDDQSSLPSFAADGSGDTSGTVRPATLRELLGRSPEIAEVASAMFEAVRSLEDQDASEISEDEIRGETMNRIPHFLDEGWTWRR